MTTTASPRHAIQVVSQRTGIPPELLRAWEKRYGAVTPARTGTARRLYSDAEIERLRLLRRATEGGRRIGDVAVLPDERLRVMVREDEEGRAARGPARTPATARADAVEAASRFRDDAFAAVDAIDPHGVRAALERAYFALGGPAMIEFVMAPVMREIGERWHRGELDPAAEHMVTAAARNSLTEMIHAAGAGGERAGDSRPGIVIATPPGERHELGAMMVAAVASAAGWQVIYLGADLPVEQLASVATRTGASAVALSVVYVPDAKDLTADLAHLRKLLPPGVVIIVGGQGGWAVRQAARGLDVLFLSGAGELGETLRGIEAGAG